VSIDRRAPRTSVLGKQRGERALFKKAIWVIIFRERLNRPVIDAVVIPRLLLPMLRWTWTRFSMAPCSRRMRQRVMSQTCTAQNGQKHLLTRKMPAFGSLPEPCQNFAVRLQAPGPATAQVSHLPFLLAALLLLLLLFYLLLLLFLSHQLDKPWWQLCQPEPV
jgi:hypothetical protein